MIKKLKKIFNYGDLLVKYAFAKHQCKKAEIENANLKRDKEMLTSLLECEKERTKKFRSSYRKKLNECEDLKEQLRKELIKNGTIKKF